MAADAFLDQLADPDLAWIEAGRPMAVFAHPDDETIALGGQLQRLSGITILHVTDGAPRTGHDAAAHGFATPADYAAARRAELADAMALAGVPADALLTLDVPDQEVSQQLAATARRLADVFRERGIERVITHAYEGGHPDHDAVAFAVHAAARLVAATGRSPELFEAPLYHRGPEGWVLQRFAPGPGEPGIAIRLSEAAQELKRRMLACHKTQARVLALVSVDVERFRAAPAYDFGMPPAEGQVLYELYGWGMSGVRFRMLAASALDELGLAS
jgi:N-acetylglucosamine malate deacetylase 2